MNDVLYTELELGNEKESEWVASLDCQASHLMEVILSWKSTNTIWVKQPELEESPEYQFLTTYLSKLGV